MKHEIHHLAALLLFAAGIFSACQKDSAEDYSVLAGLKGKWAPVSPDALTDHYLEFDRGTLTLWKSKDYLLAVDGTIWSQLAPFYVETREEYSFRDGHLLVGRNDLGSCQVEGDSLRLGPDRFFRVKELTLRAYTYLNFGEDIDASAPHMLLSKRDSTYTIPCYLDKPLLSSIHINFSDASIHVNRIRLIPAARSWQKDSLTFHLDANDSGRERLNNITFYHPASGFTNLILTQIPTMARINVPENMLSWNIGFERTDIQIAYSVDGRTKGRKLRCVSGADWIEVGDIGTKALTLSIKGNNSDAREGIATLSFDGADDVVITVSQAAYGA